MTSQTTVYPYGLRDIKLYQISGASYGTGVDLPAARTMSFTPGVKSELLEGDDTVMAAHAIEDRGNWDLEAGGVSLAAWAVLTGATSTDSASSPNEVTYIDVTSSLTRPYFGLIGKAVSDEGGDVHMQLFKAKCTTGPEGTFANGAFMLTKCSGLALPDTNGRIYRRLHHRESTDIPSTWPATPYTSS